MNALLLGGCDALVFAASDRTRDYLERLPVPVPHAICPGGGTRQESVKNALAAAESLLGEVGDGAQPVIEVRNYLNLQNNLPILAQAYQ